MDRIYKHARIWKVLSFIAPLLSSPSLRRFKLQKMTFAELWLTYQLASRAHLKDSATTQLIEFKNLNLVDLEDVLEHAYGLDITVFRQGFVEAQYRPATWWENKEGQKVKSSHSVELLLEQGVGRCPQTALKLIVQDVPTTFWFTYVYTHNASAPVVVQRVKLTACESTRIEFLAHVTNHIFKEGYLAAKLRPTVHWEAPCGKKFEEHLRVEEILALGHGTCEEKPLRLIIDTPIHPVHPPVCPAAVIVRDHCHRF
ncbi:hypothetical protein H0H81_009449 [Sphagnurus paluster]|uniref:Uncharacterized protein n=1 Tax=Sphagnurus paluster TaxID=117069 RepID=A0A9P7GPR0_9AGAR|nr:hypothetical protein H0H81_009449 [Sphagnurus paluster]